MNSEPPTVALTLDALAARAVALMADNRRFILGITGPPGAGKSTVASALAGSLGPRSALVEMDGFHLANRELERLGRRHRKGAPDTFDADGYAALLHRLRTSDREIYAPAFDRTLDESIGSAVAIGPETTLIITEGNYLLLMEGQWPVARQAVDEVWYLDVPAGTRTDRLVRRHCGFGSSPDVAERWVRDVDQPNGDAIEAVRFRADLIVRLTTQ
ncbi:nucleoside/nucleotide kinase family protein [Rhodococcus sp. IEGM 1379]|uniref:nucleoside/nucleotide kinase family protein n=1 Tax=Rhodococcus sp. IEGM 1379 TaxID=3047086 RepID=UPI0024B7AC1B|nr:nucleoside/nucleotide kinase family protein [Rhodococcus sp. IEGM 1379]MDI9913888.1 nucleoside/nucleotide kinase family protein [Rhodococcus sp. IEGM 1379]